MLNLFKFLIILLAIYKILILKSALHYYAGIFFFVQCYKLVTFKGTLPTCMLSLFYERT